MWLAAPIQPCPVDSSTAFRRDFQVLPGSHGARAIWIFFVNQVGEDSSPKVPIRILSSVFVGERDAS